MSDLTVADYYWTNADIRWSDSVSNAVSGSVGESGVLRQPRFLLRAATVPLVVTGMSGAGKSVIYDALVGHIDKDYGKTQESDDVESHKIKIATDGTKIRARLDVVPGGPTDPGKTALRAIFRSGGSLAGLIHVVNWGYREVWDTDGRQQILKTLPHHRLPTDLEGVRKYLRMQELTDFVRVSNRVKKLWAAKGDDVWLIIAVTKCDLYWEQIEEARKYYIPRRDSSSDGAFAKELRSLVEQIGWPKLAVLPVSCLSDPFDFTDTIRAESGNFSDNFRAPLISTLQNTIGEFNGP